ncbi:hypothetical protein J3A83DRAFT_4196263 [Scleroderma citrinum]
MALVISNTNEWDLINPFSAPSLPISFCNYLKVHIPFLMESSMEYHAKQIAGNTGKRELHGNMKGKGKWMGWEDDATVMHAPCMEPGPTIASPQDIQGHKQSLLHEITCPSNSLILEWPDLGITTYAPWFSDIVGIDFYWIFIMTCRLSSTPRAQEYMYSHTHPMLENLKYQENAQIQDALLLGSAVLVCGWEPKPTLNFTVEDIQLYRPTMTQSVFVQDTALCTLEQDLEGKVDLSKVHNTSTIEKFIQNVNEEKYFRAAE